MGSNFKDSDIHYAVDLVFCIDATGSMGPLLDTVKQNALNFYKDFMATMNEHEKSVEQLRIRIIAFRDYYYDREDAMLVTDFFTLPEYTEEFESCIRSIRPQGGGDEPEDGLEALAYAMKSDWTRSGDIRRHVIVVWTDDGTHDLGFGMSAPNYPEGMARDFDELTEWWGSRNRPGYMEERSKRLLLFTPDKPYWNTISANWNNVIHYVSPEAGKGLQEVEYRQILSVICNSI